MRLRSVAWAGAAAMAVGGAAAWLYADAARANDMADLPADSPSDAEGQLADGPSGEASCPALDDLDPAYVALSLDELKERVRDALPVPPSMADNHLEGVEGALTAYRAERRACMRRVMLIRTLASFEHLARPGGTYWYRGYDSRELQRHFLTGALEVDLSTDQRQDVVAFVEAQVIPALQSEGEPDREHWRRMYYGGLLACHADEALLEQLGGTRSETGCLDVGSIAEASRSVRGATGVVDPWSTDPLGQRPRARAPGSRR